MLQLQSAFGVLALLAIAWALGEKPARGVVTAGGDRTCGHGSHGAGPDQAAAGGQGFRRHQRRRQHDIGGVPRRHILRVRLSRRRHAPIRPQGIRRGFHPGVSGAADHPGHERDDHAAVLDLPPVVRGMAWLLERARRRRPVGLSPPPTSSSAWSRRRVHPPYLAQLRAANSLVCSAAWRIAGTVLVLYAAARAIDRMRRRISH